MKICPGTRLDFLGLNCLQSFRKKHTVKYTREEIAKRLRYGYEYANVVMETRPMVKILRRQSNKTVSSPVLLLCLLKLILQQSLKLLAVKLLTFHEYISESDELIVILAQ